LAVGNPFNPFKPLLNLREPRRPRKLTAAVRQSLARAALTGEGRHIAHAVRAVALATRHVLRIISAAAEAGVALRVLGAALTAKAAGRVETEDRDRALAGIDHLAERGLGDGAIADRIVAARRGREDRDLAVDLVERLERIPEPPRCRARRRAPGPAGRRQSRACNWEVIDRVDYDGRAEARAGDVHNLEGARVDAEVDAQRRDHNAQIGGDRKRHLCRAARLSADDAEVEHLRQRRGGGRAGASAALTALISSLIEAVPSPSVSNEDSDRAERSPARYPPR
jgi:hypothetical protein